MWCRLINNLKFRQTIRVNIQIQNLYKKFGLNWFKLIPCPNRACNSHENGTCISNGQNFPKTAACINACYNNFSPRWVELSNELDPNTTDGVLEV